MKRFSYFLFVISAFYLSVILAGCGKDDNPVSGDPLYTGVSTLTIEGQVYESMAGDPLYLKQYMGRYATLASSAIGDKGKFSVTIGAPDNGSLQSIMERGLLEYTDGIYISDTTVTYLIAYLAANGNDELGDYEAKISWQNKPPLKIPRISATYYNGIYCYFDKDLTVQGTFIEDWRNHMTYSYDFKVKAGWNILLETSYYNFVSNESSVYLTNMVPSSTGHYICTFSYYTTMD